MTFEAGLYGSLDDIHQVIKALAIHSDANFADLTISLVGVAATQKAHVELSTATADTCIMRFTPRTRIGPLIGFTTDKYFTAYSTDL